MLSIFRFTCHYFSVGHRDEPKNVAKSMAVGHSLLKGKVLVSSPRS